MPCLAYPSLLKLCAVPILLTGLLTSLVAEQSPVADFPQMHSDILPDPQVRWGSLGNGMRYCLLPNQQPRDKVSMRLLVESGSLLEREEQRGLAHFLEHMAFNGSTHYPPGTLVKVLQDLGLAFGADTNAHTSFDETVYKLDLPDAKSATIATGLQVFSDYAGGMLIQPSEVDRERGVILAEMRDRDTPGFREYLAIYQACYPGLVIADRFPIGLKSTVEHGDAALMRDFYDHWYRPERMVLALVGAFDPDQVEAQVRGAFAGLAARAPEVSPPAFGTPLADGFSASYHREAEAPGTMLILTQVSARAHPHDSQTLQRTYLLHSIAEDVIGRRMRDLIAKQPHGPLLEANAESYQWLDLWHVGMEAKVRPGQALAAVAVVEQELRRFLRYGPTENELQVARAAMTAALDEGVARAADRTNAELCDGLYISVRTDTVFRSPQQERDFVKPLLAQISVEAVQQAYQQAWAHGHESLVVTGVDDLGADGTQALSSAFTASQAIAVDAPIQHSTQLWGYAQAPAPGTWKTEPSADHKLPLDILPGVLDNGVTVRIKHTDFKHNEVLVALRLAIPAQPCQPGVREFAARAFERGGLGRHSAAEMHDVLAGTSVHLGGLQCEDDGIVFTASCLPGEFELCCQQMRAYLADPGWRSDGEALAKSEWLEQLRAIDTNLDQKVGRTFQALSVADAPQRRSATLEEAEKVDFSVVRPWLSPYLSHAPMEISIVGDIDPGKASDLVATYFGSLPPRDPVLTLLGTDAQAIDRTALASCPSLPLGLHNLEVSGTVARALIDVAWPTTDYYDIQLTRRLGVLAGVITERMRVRIRQELGDAYSPYAVRIANEAYRDSGFVIAQVGVAPAKAEEGRAALLALAQELADKGVSADLLAQVTTPITKSLASQLQQNQYWLRVLERCASQPFRIAWAQSIENDYNSITPEQISALARQYLDNTKTLQVVGVCKGVAGAASGSGSGDSSGK